MENFKLNKIKLIKNYEEKEKIINFLIKNKIQKLFDKYTFNMISNKIIKLKIRFNNEMLYNLENNEKRYEMERMIVKLNPKNIKFCNLINDHDIIEAIKKDKDIIFLVKKFLLSYKIILEAIKIYGNYIFFHSVYGKISLNFLNMSEFNNLNKELKIFYYNDRFARKYIKMFNIIYLSRINCLKNEMNEIMIK